MESEGDNLHYCSKYCYFSPPVSTETSYSSITLVDCGLPFILSHWHNRLWVTITHLLCTASDEHDEAFTSVWHLDNLWPIGVIIQHVTWCDKNHSCLLTTRNSWLLWNPWTPRALEDPCQDNISLSPHPEATINMERKRSHWNDIYNFYAEILNITVLRFIILLLYH